MKKLLLFILTLAIIFYSCKKTDTSPQTNQDKTISDSTIIVSSNVINSSLIGVDSTKLIFTSTGNGVDKVKVGSILVSDISTVAPMGFLRKVTGITTSGNKRIFTTEQASLTDAIVNGNVTYSKTFTDADIISEDSSGVDISAQERTQGLSFTFNYNKVLYDADGNYSTTYDQVKINGEMKFEPTFDFELDIKHRKVQKFVAKITLKNTNNINAESKAIIASLNEEIVLKTFQLQPFTIPVAGVPIPIAKQWIAIVLGVDGNLTATVTTGAQNINTAVAGISYQNNTWNTINTIDNSFTFQPLIFGGAARVEPYLQLRYEIRPYGIKESRIYLGIRGSIIGEATSTSTGLNTNLKWGIKLSAKAQMEIWDRAILDYEKVFFEKEFPITSQQAMSVGWKIVAAGGNHSLGIKLDGSLWVWGRNVNGELGDGTTTNKSIPVRIGTSNSWEQISAGSALSLGIKKDGSLWAWGYWNGDGVGHHGTIPERVGTANDWKQVSAGGGHSLGIKSDGSLWAWGDNAGGQLGDGTTINKSTPVRIGTSNSWKQVAAGYIHSLGIKSDGSLWAWGGNGEGQLGDGTTISKRTPVRIGTSNSWEQVAVGEDYSLGIKSDGSLWAWGLNGNGQLGDGTTISQRTPIRIGTSKSWKQISVDYIHSLGIKSDGSLWAWGVNSEGELGDGTTIGKNIPVRIGTANDWKLVSTGDGHSLGIKSDGSLWAWGFNSYGELGDGTTTNRLIPTKIYN